MIKSKKVRGHAKWRFVLAIAAGFGLVNLATAQTKSLAQERTETINGNQYLLTSKLKAIVLGEFTFGFDHTVAYPNMDSTISRIGRQEKPAWTIGRMKTANQVTAASLANYQIFFANYISGMGGGRNGGFTSVQQAALQDFVEVKGNGLFLIHSSGDSPVNPSWPWYASTVHPCHYTGEAGAGAAASTGRVGIWSQNAKAAKSHPIMQGINWGGSNPDSVSIIGNELHTFDKAISNPAITPAKWQGLLGLNATTCGTPNTCSGNAYNYTTAGGPSGWPISWTFPAQKGNIGYFMEGHDLITMNSMTQVMWDKFFKQFMYYMAGYDTTAVVGIKTGQNLNMGVDQSGITFHPDQEAGVLITKAGNHLVSLFGIDGHKVAEEKGNKTPIDYNFATNLKGLHSGLYIMRVAVPGAVRSAKIYLK